MAINFVNGRCMEAHLGLCCCEIKGVAHDSCLVSWELESEGP